MSDGETPLFTGWEPEAPASDTIVRAFLLNCADASVVAVEAQYGRILGHGEPLGATLVAVDLGRPAGLANCTTLLQPLGAHNQEEVLAALDTFYGAGDDGRSGMVVLFSAWPTPDLRPNGWRLMGHPPLHLLPPGQALPPPPSGLRIELVQDGAALADWELVAVHGYPLPDLGPYLPGGMFPARLLNDGRWRFWLGRHEDGRAVSCAAAFVAHGLNNVAFVATLPEARGRGYGRALTWRAALADPALPAVLLSSDDGRPVYERMGFVPLLRFTLWFRDR
jgi:GNAT superfamily N-acetyltransferase